MTPTRVPNDRSRLLPIPRLQLKGTRDDDQAVIVLRNLVMCLSHRRQVLQWEAIAVTKSGDNCPRTYSSPWSHTCRHVRAGCAGCCVQRNSEPAEIAPTTTARRDSVAVRAASCCRSFTFLIVPAGQGPQSCFVVMAILCSMKMIGPAGNFPAKAGLCL